MSWFSISDAPSKDIQCPACEGVLAGYLPRADHHPAKCVHCAASLLVFSASPRNIAIHVAKAPSEMKAFIAWAQDEFSELEFVSFFVSFEELLGIESRVS